MTRDLRPSARGEEGFALVTVLLATLALMILAMSAVAFGVGSQELSRHDQNWNAALAAAEAGLDHFVFRMNDDDSYYTQAQNPAPSPFDQWTSVPGAVPGGPVNPMFRYTIDVTNLPSQQSITVEASGKVGNSVRTVEAVVRRHSFLDYLYLTNFETMDPVLYPNATSNHTPQWAATNCSRYYYPQAPTYTGNRTDGTNACVNISFASFDQINGPLHSNDAYYICGSAHFNGSTSTSWTGANGKMYIPSSGCTGSPVFVNGNTDPHHADVLAFPPSNTAIINETRPPNGTGGGGGCLYTGPTAITLNSNGTMTVNSKFSRNTVNGCPTNGTGPLPSNGVIYVQNVPSVPADPNYSPGCMNPATGTSFGTPNHPLGYPIAGDATSYGCLNGDAFVKGTLKGRLTIAAQNNIDIIGNLPYQGGLAGSDLLGLIANNFVEVYHPVKIVPLTSSNSCSSGWHKTGSWNSNPQLNGTCEQNLATNFTSCSSPTSGPQCATISAAMLAVTHSVRVQNYNYGTALGSLSINGAFSQMYRGIVGTFNGSSLQTGYAKNYNYDQRLKYLQPPKFLNPVAAAWQSVSWAERNPKWCKAPSFTTAC